MVRVAAGAWIHGQAILVQHDDADRVDGISHLRRCNWGLRKDPGQKVVESSQDGFGSNFE